MDSCNYCGFFIGDIFLIGSTSFFTRGIDLVETFIYLFIWVPALGFVILLIVLLKKKKLPKKMILQIISFPVVTLLSLFFVVNFIVYTNTAGWLTPNIRTDYVQITCDGKYEYQLEIINLFQRNSRVRLHIKDLSSQKEMTLPLSFSIREIRGITIPHTPFHWITMESTDTPGQYIAWTTDRLSLNFSEIFEINIESETSVKLYREENFRSMFVRIKENEQYKYTYTIRLIDTYQDGVRINVEAFLRIVNHIPGGTHYFSLPVDINLLENPSLRQSRNGGITPPLWVTLEETDIHGQFIVQTTEELSKEITLTFLVSIENNTLEKID
jgi:hypothetical protein